MDRVRFGRALGTGARAAAKSLMSAAEAAAAPAPTAARPVAPAQPAIQTPVRPAASRPAAAPRVAFPDAQRVAGQAKNLKRSVWKPLARYSSVLWLEVTGFFFGIFAAILGNQVWKQRAAVHLSAHDPAAQHFYVYCALFALFAYFTASSFIRAKRRQRR